MRNSRFVFSVGLVALFVGMPTKASSQDCTWCYQCPEPWEDLMITEDNKPGGHFILYPMGGLHCREYEEGECDALIQCDPGEDEEQQAELIALIDEGNASRLRDFLKEREDQLDRVPARNLLLLRGGCRDEIIGVFELEAELFSRIEEGQG